MARNAPLSDNRFGVRVYLMGEDTVLLYQTVKRGKQQNSPYVVDQNPARTGELFVDIDDDKGIADAVRAALRGEL